MARTIMTSKRTVVSMQKLYMKLLEVSLSVGDMSFTEYSFLANAFDAGGILSLKRLRRAVGMDIDISPFVSMLEHKDLFLRTRDSVDRRGFAVKVTSKGVSRLQMVDQAVSTELVATNPNMTERTFLRLANSMHLLSAAVGYGADSEHIFTGAPLIFMNAYHHLVMVESSYFGMTSLQMALLCMFDKQGVFHSEQLQNMPTLSPEVIEYQISTLVENGCVQESERTLEITQKGVKRLSGFAKRIDTLVKKAEDECGSELMRAANDLCECCVYLYA